ncbi:cyclopropane-fatty-acyl-phospholipid synthase family protein [Flexibacterium corallicola]|uniref:cyclopropane-fatty-acyl-phospholipid synthase family protein n=1 Tax=Flexibacterium corallicola TaxID=3037259 RepID=UPI00286F8B67|nr:cyclopropane-fatty-acyl-phospholipid synthase family protein [Pseudovibrio sp. M1P-2-3]
MRALSKLLKAIVSKGQLVIFDVKGNRFVFGGIEPGPHACVKIHDERLYSKLLYSFELGAAEAYMDGTLTLENGTSLNDVLSVFVINNNIAEQKPFYKALLRVFTWIQRRGHHLNINRTKAQVRHHYDLSTDLYRLFLDEGLNYSCGYFKDPAVPLELAQKAKLDHILAKLDLKPGMRVLEIGGGWGSLAIRMGQAGFDVTSLNVSNEQIKIARERVANAGLSDSVKFVCKDYNEFEGRFDRVVSVGMMEHVGIGNYGRYFSMIRRCLKDDGFALIHAIGRYTPPSYESSFMNKYIFPGGYCPSMSEVFEETEKTKLWVCDSEIWRLHYHYTLEHWAQNFAKNRAQIKEIYDERFCRMWEFYLAACSVMFLHGKMMVFQILLSKERSAVPIIRDYMFENEIEINEESESTRRRA